MRFNMLGDANHAGPVRLSDTYDKEVGGAQTGIAASQKALYDAYNSLNSIIIKNSVAGYHNSIYRGKCLGSVYTAEQKAAITSGTFEDLFIGDYWTIDGNDYVICHFDYYINCSDSNIDYHHVVVMPRGNMKGLSFTAATTSRGTDSPANGTACWNTSHTTAGGYIESHIRTVVMPACDAKVKAAFGASNVHAISELYPNAFVSPTDGRTTNWDWTSTDYVCDLCNETMVYGHQAWGTGISDGREACEIGIDKWQLAIFRLDPGFANTRVGWWLRSVFTEINVADVNDFGIANGWAVADEVRGVRPRFLLS